jgi:hypothetical protein
MDQVQLVITLHSGKVIEKPILKPCEKDDESIFEGKERVKPEYCKEKTDSPLVLLFSHVMTKQKEVNHDSKILKISNRKKSRTKKAPKMLLRIISQN